MRTLVPLAGRRLAGQPDAAARPPGRDSDGVSGVSLQWHPVSSPLGQDPASLLKHEGGPHAWRGSEYPRGDGHAVVVLCGEPDMSGVALRSQRLRPANRSSSLTWRACGSVSGAGGFRTQNGFSGYQNYPRTRTRR